MKRWITGTLLTIAAIAGVIRVQLVAQDQPPAASESFAEQAAALASQLPASGDLGKLKAALATEEGQLVLRGRAEAHTQAENENARANAIPNYIEQHFQPNDSGQLVARDSQYAQQLAATTKQFQADVARTAAVLEGFATQLSGDDDKTEFIRQFLRKEGPTMLYMLELRKRIRPTREVLEYQLRQLLVRDSSGNYRLREDHRAEAQQMADKLLPMLKGQKVLHETIAGWADGLAEHDDLHKRAKKALTSPAFALFVAARAAEKSGSVSANPRAVANRIADQLDEATDATLKGLAFRPETQEKVQELLDEYAALSRGADSVRPLLRKLAGRIIERDELHKSWRELLQSELGAMKLGEALGELTVGDGEQDLRSVVEDIIGPAFEKQGDRYVLRADRQQELLRQIQEVVRQHRRVLRHARAFDDVTEKIADPKLREALQTEAAKFVIAQQISEQLKQSLSDGLNQWAEKNLERTAAGQWVLTEAGEREVSSILLEIQKVREQLEKDDF